MRGRSRKPAILTPGIDGLVRTSAGFSRENWVFDLVSEGERRPLIARRDPVGSVLETDRAVETAVLRALEGSEVPAPVVVWSDPEGDRLGRPTVVMERADGVCDWFVLTGDRPLDTRVAIAHQLYDRLADIHRVRLARGRPRCGARRPGCRRGALAAVDHWEDQLRRVQLEPEPELELVLAWLRTPRPHVARHHARARRLQARQHPAHRRRGHPGARLGDRGTSATRTRTSAGSPTRCAPASTASPTRGSPTTSSPRWSARTGIEVDRASRCTGGTCSPT